MALSREEAEALVNDKEVHTGDAFVGNAFVGATYRAKRVVKRSAGNARPQFSKLACVGLVFDKALDVATYSPGQPSEFRVVVYRQRQNRSVFGEGTKFWDKETTFSASTLAEADKKAKEYIASHGWQYMPFTEAVV